MDYHKIKDESMSISDWIISIRRELHEHTELMYEEFKTSELIRRELDKLEIPLILSVFAGRIADTGIDPMKIMNECSSKTKSFKNCKLFR